MVIQIHVSSLYAKGTNGWHLRLRWPVIRGVPRPFNNSGSRHNSNVTKIYYQISPHLHDITTKCKLSNEIHQHIAYAPCQHYGLCMNTSYWRHIFFRNHPIAQMPIWITVIAITFPQLKTLSIFDEAQRRYYVYVTPKIMHRSTIMHSLPPLASEFCLQFSASKCIKTN